VSFLSVVAISSRLSGRPFAKAAFAVPLDVGVEVWCIGREALNVVARVAGEKRLDLLTGMNAAASPEEHDRTPDPPREVA
jgi:hypothetical protein